MKGIKKIIMLAVVMLGMLVGLIFSAGREQFAKASAEAENGGSIVLDNNATLTMAGGSISGSSANNGGAIYIGDGATFTMNGGSIENCTGVYGGAIYVASGGECYLMSGRIENCEGTYGGAVYVEEGGYLYIEEGFIITGCGADYSESLGFVRQQDVNRPVTIYPYNNLQELSEIKARSNQTLNEVGLPDLTGCSWFKESSYDNRYNLSTYVGANTNYDDMSMYFTGHNFANAGSASSTGCLSFTEECEYGCGTEQTRYYSHDSNSTSNSSTYSSYGSYTTVSEATCTSPAQQRRLVTTYHYEYDSCSKCGTLMSSGTYVEDNSYYQYRDYGSVDSSNHTGSQSTTTVTAATCTSTGTSKTTWSCCGASSTSTIAALGHNYRETSREPASGYYYIYTNWVTVSEATCTEPEKQQRTALPYYYSNQTCSRCGNTTRSNISRPKITETQESGSALGHSVSDGYCPKATKKTRSPCSRCGVFVAGYYHLWMSNSSGGKTCSYCGISTVIAFAPSGGEHSHEEDIEINIERTLQQINTIVDLSNITFESNVNTKVTLVSEEQYMEDALKVNEPSEKAMVILKSPPLRLILFR